MGGGIHPVGRKADFYDIVCREMQIILCRSTHNGRRVQNHDSVMGRSYPEFVFRTDHSIGLHASYLGFLYLEIFSEPRPYGSQQYFLSGRHIRGSADYLQKIRGAGIQFCHMKMVRIRMVITFHDLCHYHTCKPSGNLLHLL